MGTDCVRLQERLSDYLRGQVCGRELRVLECHLRRCADCRGALVLERELLALGQVEPPGARGTVGWAAVQERCTHEPLPARLQRRLRLRRATAAAFLFRALADPWLRLAEQLLASMRPLRQGLEQTRHLLVEQLVRGLADDLNQSAVRCGRQIRAPLLAACRQIPISVALRAR